MKDPGDEVPAHALWAIQQLSPSGGTISEKYENNAWSNGMFVTGSQINHECIASCEATPLTNDGSGATAFVASRDIAAGEEISIAYRHLLRNTYSPGPPTDRRQVLSEKWGFDCTCAACTDPVVIRLVGELTEVHDQLTRYWAGFHEVLPDSVPFWFLTNEMYLHTARCQLGLLEQLQMSVTRVASTHFGMFQVAIRERETLKDGIQSLNLAKENLMALIRDKPVSKYLQIFSEYLDDPSLHPAYLQNE